MTSTLMPSYAVENLRWLVDTYYQSQKLRIQLGNRLAAVEREVDTGPPPPSAKLMYERLEEAEDSLVEDMRAALIGHPALPWLNQIKGIGPTLGAKLLGLIGDIGKFETVSKLWRFAGFAVMNGERERPTKGRNFTIRFGSRQPAIWSGVRSLSAGAPTAASMIGRGNDMKLCTPTGRSPIGTSQRCGRWKSFSCPISGRRGARRRVCRSALLTSTNISDTRP